MLESLDGTEVGAAMAAIAAFGAGIRRWWRVEQLHKANTGSQITAIQIWKDLSDRALKQLDDANARVAAAQAQMDAILENARKEREEDRRRITDLTASIRELRTEQSRLLAVQRDLVNENARMASELEQLRTIVGSRRKEDGHKPSGPLGVVA